MSAAGQRLAGRYTLATLLGHGGMGAVYEAFDDAGGVYAIKLLDPSLASDESTLRRFAREARILSELRSPHVVRVREAGREDGRPFLVMELLRGHDLGERLRQERTLPIEETLDIAAQVLEGLAAAHEAGVVHRDLKPDNVFLAEVPGAPPRATLIDFGMSKQASPSALTAPLALTAKGTVLGTPFYLSPEQARAGDVDARADLYGLGAILFECLTGRPPHVGESHEQVLIALCTRDAPDPRAIDPRIPRDVAKLVLRALARDREARPASARAMARELAELRTQPKDPGVAGRPGEPVTTAEERAEASSRGGPRGATRRARPSMFALGLFAAVCGALTTALVLLAVAARAPTSTPSGSSRPVEGAADADAASASVRPGP